MTKGQAISYARVSSREQEQGYSIPAQQKALRAYASSENIEIVREFVDVETAKESGRANFEVMLAYLRRHPNVRNLLVEKTDRLYRNVQDWLLCEQISGLHIHFVKEGTVLSRESRSHEKFFHGIKVLMAKNYVDNLSEEARKGMQEKASQGFWPSCSPIGYRNVLADNGRRIIEVDAERGPIVSELFNLYANGTVSIAELAEQARRLGLVHRRNGRALARSNIHSILRNPIYAGQIVWCGTVYEGLHQPLVSRELFQKVQSVLDVRSKRKVRDGKKSFAYSGLIRCGHCGCAMVGERKKKRYVYYHCTGWKKKCPERYVREEIIADQFSDILGRIRFTGDAEKWLIDAVLEGQRYQLASCETTIARLRTGIGRIQGRIESLYIDKLEGIIDQATFETVSARSAREKEALMASLSEQETVLSRHANSRQAIVAGLSRSVHLFKRQGRAEQRRLLVNLVDHARWRDKMLTVQLRPPFCWLPIVS